MYVTELSKYMKPSSISSYLQGIVFVHNVLGISPPSVSSPFVRSTMNGIKNDFPEGPSQKEPIYLEHLGKMKNFVVPSDHYSVLTWIASLLMFRCLLRVGQVVDSPHTLTRDCVTFTDFGCTMKVKSSKTSSLAVAPVIIPEPAEN